MKVTEDVKGNPLNCSLYLDGFLKNTLDDTYKLVKKDFDVPALFFGMEGAGKTVIAMTCAYYLDANFSLDRVVFNPEQFEEIVDNLPRYSVILWDEADDLGVHAQSKMLRAIKRKFKRIRSHNLIILLVTPTIFDLNRYFVLHRTRFCIQVYTNGLQRGFFKFYNMSNKRLLYLKGRKEWNNNAYKPNYIGRFTKLPEGFPIDWDSYNDKKDNATLETVEEKKSSQSIEKELRKKYFFNLKKYMEVRDIKITLNDYASIFDCNRTTLSKYNKGGVESEGETGGLY